MIQFLRFNSFDSIPSIRYDTIRYDPIQRSSIFKESIRTKTDDEVVVSFRFVSFFHKIRCVLLSVLFCSCVGVAAVLVLVPDILVIGIDIVSIVRFVAFDPSIDR